MWEININIEATALLWSVLLGIGAAVLYDLIRAANKVFKPNIPVLFVLDLLYWIVLTFVFFCFFMVFTNGQVRMFAIFGAVAGFILGFLCFFKIPLVLFSVCFKALKFVFNKIKAFFARFGKGVTEITKKSLKKAILKIKKA